MTGRGGDAAEIPLKRGCGDFLFYRGDYYYPSVEIPRGEAFDADAEQTELRSFSATIKVGESGTQDIPALRFECQGVRYALPAHQIVVLDSLPKDEGLSVVSRPDPNGSGSVEVVLTFHSVGESTDIRAWFDRSKCPETLEILHEARDTRYKGHDAWRSLKLVLRNRADAPFVLKPEHIKNLPEVKNWPVIEIKPAPPDDSSP